MKSRMFGIEMFGIVIQSVIQSLMIVMNILESEMLTFMIQIQSLNDIEIKIQMFQVQIQS